MPKFQNMPEPITERLEYALKSWTFEGEERELLEDALEEIQSLGAQVKDAKDDVQNVLCALESQPNWRDMTIAPPDDGTAFIAAVEVFDTQTKKPLGWDMYVVSIDHETGDLADDDYHGWSITDYTHWHPLPMLPNGDNS